MPTLRQRAKVERLISKWKGRLLLSNWTTVHVFADTKEPEPEIIGKSLRTLASISVVSRYCDAEITIYPPFWRESAFMQEITIVHELCHILTEPMRVALYKGVDKGALRIRDSDDLIEGLTEHIAKVLMERYARHPK